MTTPWCAVLGDPIDHSLSPVLHTAGSREAGLDWEYRRHRVDADGLGPFLDDLDDDCRGLSLTMPLKRRALEHADEVSDIARTAGAANTLVVAVDGRRRADNTDVPGAAAAIRETYDGPLGTATIWGGGATAASVLLALAERGLERATLAVRDPGRAAETLAAVGRHPDPPEMTVVPLDGLASVEADLVVSTIPASAQQERLLAAVADVPVVFDVLYDPWPTPLAAAATADGRTLVGGLDLLVWQAVDQLRAMTGRFDVPVAAMRQAGEVGLAERRR